MKKLSFFTSLLILTSINIYAQDWVVTNYKDEFGDPSGKRSIKQKIEGSLASTDNKLIVEISRDVPSTNDFTISAFALNGARYEYLESKTVMKEGYSKEKYKKNPSMDPIKAGDAKAVEGKYLFKYKIGDKGSSFRILKPNTALGNKTRTNTIRVNYKELDAILLSTSVPIKCIIAEENVGGSVSNLIRFTLYPSNYKLLVH
jgi:hypothetical protein